MENLKQAVEEEDLGRVKTILNANPALVTQVYEAPDGEPFTILKRAQIVASHYPSPAAFAHRIVAELKRRGATLPPAPQLEGAFNHVANNGANLGVAEANFGWEAAPAGRVFVQPRPRRPGLPPLHPVSQAHTNVSKGIAARNKPKANTRKRKARKARKSRRLRRRS